MSLERQVRLYRTLTALLLGVLLLGATLAARPVSSVLPLLQTHRLEVVDEAGKRVFVAGVEADSGLVQLWNRTGALGLAAHASPTGGRLDVFTPSGTLAFSAGSRQNAPDPAGLWEQLQRAFERQERELDTQRRLIDDLNRQLRSQPSRPGGAPDQRSHEIDQLRNQVDQQRRSIDTLERNIQNLSNQLRSLERR